MSHPSGLRSSMSKRAELSPGPYAWRACGPNHVKVGRDLLADLDPEQRRAAETLSGPMCVIAGAGTGKTRTITYRLAHAVASGVVPPSTALAVTFTRKAAAELKERLAALGVGGAVDARTFHGAARRVVHNFWPRTGRPGSKPELVSESDAWRMWRDALRSVMGFDPPATAVRDALDEVSWARSRLLTRERYPEASIRADRSAGVTPSVVVAAWERVEGAKARVGLLDFADLLDIAASLLESDDEVASRVRRRWAYVTVDEYQDVAPAQQHFLDAVLGPGRELCVVGDPRQSIYSWNGADPAFLSGLTKRYPEAAVIDLVRNYRSSPQILRCANRLAAEPGLRPLVATKSGGPEPAVVALEDEQAEAAWVVRTVEQAMAAGTPLSEIAILYRFNAQQARFEAALANADIATTVAEDTTFFEREEIRIVVERVARSVASAGTASGIDVLRAALARTGFDESSPPEGQGAARARWESQRSLLDVARELPEADRADAATLSATLRRLSAHTHGPRTSGVTLATLHRAKGLEWDVVFIVGLVDGVLPSSRAVTPDAQAEEERLVHVGTTRARRELHLTWAMSSPRGWTNKPSPYLAQMRPPRRPASSAECPHCSDALKGISARRLGVCANCVLSAPGSTGEWARAIATIVSAAAARLGVGTEELVSRKALLRLLDTRPTTVAEVDATPGVNRAAEWATAVLDLWTD